MTGEGAGAERDDEGPVVTALLTALAEDLAKGGLRPREEYLQRFLGHEDVVRRELDPLLARPEPPSENPARADVFGPYRIVRRLGRGGFGTVYVAEDATLGRRVALKVLHGLGALSSEQVARFEREARLLARVDHPGLVTVHAAGTVDGTPYLAMQLVEGVTLDEQLKEARAGGRPPDAAGVRAATSLAAAVADALEAAHEVGIVHRDVKAANVLVTAGGAPVLVDFGIAFDRDEAPLTRSWEQLGTLAAMAPEQLARAPVDGRADVWALGALLHELLTLERPFDAPSVEERLAAIRTSEPPDARRGNDAVPRDLAVVVATALRADPARRYPSARAFAADLRAVLDGRPVSARPTGTFERLVRAARRRPARSTLVAALALGVPAALVLLGFLAARLPEARAFRERARAERVRAAVEEGFLELMALRPEAALASFERARAEAPSDPEANAGVARALLSAGRLDEAERHLDLHAAEMPGLVAVREMRRSLARERRAASGGEEATDARDEALEPPDAPAADEEGSGAFDAYLLGLAHLRRAEHGDEAAWARAEAALDRALALAEEARPIYHCERARIAGLRGDDAVSRRMADALRALWPDSSVAAFYAGFARQGCGDVEGALLHLARAARLDETNVLARNGYGAALLEAGRLEAAATEFEAVLAQDADDWTAHFCLGLLHESTGDFERAARHYRRSLEEDETNEAARAGLERSLAGRSADDASEGP